ncbi:flagellar protein FlaG [Paenibacillus dauci]|uniref:flagellar protein FlaG n=1 Tax=Paenibacillus dauci TaxID=1567106 RepID=UPI000619EC0F|nr:flagellar protein FlaG [Paenibacillus dauci]
MDFKLTFSSSGSYTPSITPSSTPSDNSLMENASVSEVKRLEKQGAIIPAGQEEVIKRLEHAFKALSGPETTLEVSMHKETHSIMVKVLNKDTGEVIREVPPEKTLDLVANMMHIAGILVDKRT